MRGGGGGSAKLKPQIGSRGLVPLYASSALEAGDMGGSSQSYRLRGGGVMKW